MHSSLNMLADIPFAQFSTIILGLLATVTAIYLIPKKSRVQYPSLNNDPSEYISDARALLARGVTRYGDKPFSILVPQKSIVILPPSLSNWVKTSRDLDHQQLVRDDFFATYPGFESQQTLHHPNRAVINMVQGKLSKNDQTLAVLDAHIRLALTELWGEDNQEWKHLDWDNGTSGLISRAAASVFVGPELATDPEWQDVTRSYVQEFFAAAPQMQSWHPWLRPIVHCFLPHTVACRALTRRARSLINAVIDQRLQKAKAAESRSEKAPEYHDALSWTLDSPGTSSYHPGDVQLALAMAAYFTTAEVLRQVLIDIACRPQLIEALREEMEHVITQHGVTPAALTHLELLDSVMKESQRLAPALGKRTRFDDVPSRPDIN